MRAEILSCGTELLLGHITDTNATYLAQSLSNLRPWDPEGISRRTWERRRCGRLQ